MVGPQDGSEDILVHCFLAHAPPAFHLLAVTLGHPVFSHLPAGLSSCSCCLALFVMGQGVSEGSDPAIGILVLSLARLPVCWGWFSERADG